MKIIKKTGFKNYICEDNNEYLGDIDISGNLQDETGLYLYDLTDGLITPVVYTQEEVEEAELKHELEIQAEGLREEALQDLTTIHDVVKVLQLRVSELQATMGSLIEQSTLQGNPEAIKQYIFEDQFTDLSHLNLSNCSNYKHLAPNTGGRLDGLVIPKDREVNLVLESVDLIDSGDLESAVKTFQVVGHGAIPKYNFGLMIEIFDDQGAKIQLYDENNNPVDYVQYTSGSLSLSDKMHFATAVTSLIIRVTMIPHGVVPEDPITGVPFLSAYGLVYSKE